MNDVLTIKSTSNKSALGQDIELRVTSTSRLVFRPVLVDNIHDKRASVKGWFIFQRKGIKEDWIDYKTLNLSKLKVGDWIKLELKSAELLKLITELDKYYKIFEKYGIQKGEIDFVVTPKNVKSVILSFLQNPENFAKLQDLKIEDLKKLNLISSVNSLKSILNVWELNKSNSEEEYWQNFFKQNSWLIGQIFSFPVVLFKDKAYVGGKSIDNSGGNIVDFIYRSGFTENILMVEIKTPTTKLLGSEYRDGAYCLSSDLSGAISQVLKYKHEIQQNYSTLTLTKPDNFRVFEPKCMLIIGSIEKELLTDELKRSFTLLRNDSKSVEIVSFDEMFKKVEMLIGLLEQ